MITMETIVQAIGATDARVEYLVESPWRPQELVPTIFFHLGICRKPGRWAGRYGSW